MTEDVQSVIEYWRKELPRVEGFPAPLFAEKIRQTIAILEASANPQCCMCGKKGLSTVEGDGGPECQLGDDRWTCSRECYDRATDTPDKPELTAQDPR